MTVYQWLCLFSVPALILMIVKYMLNQIKQNRKDTEAVKLGLQALLRSQMISDYNKYSEKALPLSMHGIILKTAGSSIILWGPMV